MKKLLTIGVLAILFLISGIVAFKLLRGEAILGIGTPPAAYSTTLSQPITSSATTIYVSSLTAGDTALTTSNIYPGIFLTLEASSQTKRELVFCTTVGTLSFTGCTRGLSFVGVSMDGVAANQQSHQSGTSVIASDPPQFFVYMLVNRWQEQWIKSKLHFESATSSDRTGFSLGNNTATDIYTIFANGATTSSLPYLMRQQSTGNLIYSSNGIDQITLGGTAVSSTGGRGVIAEAITGGNALSVATSTNFNSANLYGLKFTSESGRDRLILSGYYNATDFTFASLKASSTYIQDSTGLNNFYVDNSGNISASGTARFLSTLHIGGNETASGTLAVSGSTTSSNIYPWTNNNIDIGAYNFAWRDVYASGTIYANNFGNPILPSATGKDIGSYVLNWNNIFASGTVYASSLVIDQSGSFTVNSAGTSTFTGTLQSNSAGTSTFAKVWTDQIGNRAGSGTTTVVNGLQVNGDIDWSGEMKNQYISTSQSTASYTVSDSSPSNATRMVVTLECDNDTNPPSPWRSFYTLYKNSANIDYSQLIGGVDAFASEMVNMRWSATSSLFTAKIANSGTLCDGVKTFNIYYFK